MHEQHDRYRKHRPPHPDHQEGNAYRLGFVGQRQAPPRAVQPSSVHAHDAAGMLIEGKEIAARADLDDDEMLSLAVVRLLEIVGEAAEDLWVDDHQQLDERHA